MGASGYGNLRIPGQFQSLPRLIVGFCDVSSPGVSVEIRRAGHARPARGNGRVATSRRVAMARAGLQCPNGRRRESPEMEVWWGEKSCWEVP